MSDAKSLRLTAIAASLATCFGSAWAADEEANDLVKELIEPESSVSIGAGSWSKDRHQFGIYDGMREGGTYGQLDIDFARREPTTGTWLMLTGRNLGLENRELRGEWLRQGDIGLSLEYSRLVRDNPLTFTTGLRGIGTESLRTSGTAPANTLPAREVSLGTERDMTQIGFYKNLMSHLDLRISFKNEEKDGTRQWGWGSAPLFAVEPIDSTTRQLEATLSYSGEKFQIEGGYYASWYENHNSLVLARVNGVADGAVSGNPTNPTPLSLPLDNQAYQLYLNGGYSLTTTTRGTFKLSYARATQDETIPMPFNLNPLDLAPRSLDGRIDTTAVEFGLSSRPLPRLSIVANLRYRDVKDKTPLHAVIGTDPAGPVTGYNTPHSIRTKSGKLEATYRLPADFSLTGGVDVKDQNRTAPTVGTVWVPFAKDLDETTWQLKLRRSLAETVSGSLAYLLSKREGSNYVLPTDVSPPAGGPYTTEDAVNPIHIADRKRNKWRGMLDWTPTEKLSLQFAVEDSRDRYDFRSQIIPGDPESVPAGVKSGDASLFSLDASYTFNEKWQASVWYARDLTKVKQMSWNNTAGALNQMVADLKETGDSFGLGVKGEVYRKFRVGANLEWTRSVSEFDQPVSARPAGTSALEDINTTVVRFKFFSEHDLAKNSTVRLDLIHERWRTDDWTWSFSDGSPFTYGTTTDGTIVTAAPKQNASFVGARYIYKFQ